MQRVDAHFHLWDLKRGDYHWLDQSDESLSPIARNFEFDDIAPISSAEQIQKFVVIQAAASEAETDYLLSLSDKHNDISGVVGWANIASEDAVDILQKWSKHPKFKGIRPMLQDIGDTHWLIAVPSAKVWDSLVDLGLRFDALVQPRHLSMLNNFAKSYPKLPIVIDHAAKPKLGMAGDKVAFREWSSGMNLLAQNSLVYCKISGLLTEMDFAEPNAAIPMLKTVFDVLLTAFGPSRLMWGSDWPVLNLASDYKKWNEISLNLLSDLDAKSQKMILGGTAHKFYDLQITISENVQ